MTILPRFSRNFEKPKRSPVLSSNKKQNKNKRNSFLWYYFGRVKLITEIALALHVFFSFLIVSLPSAISRQFLDLLWDSDQKQE